MKSCGESGPSPAREYSEESHEWQLQGTVVVLQLSFSAADNKKNDEGSDNVAVIGSDPRLMGMWCTVEARLLLTNRSVFGDRVL